MPRAIVVVPCYNEAERLNLCTIQEFGRHSESAELLFVNDGSRDETLELLEYLHQSNPRRFSFLHLAKNRGKAEAVRQGLLSALKAQPDYVGFWDADLATPLADIDSFCRVLSRQPQIDAVIGTRMRLLGHRIQRQPLRYWLGRLFARVASLALGVPIFDTQCGAKMFRATPRLRAIVERPFLSRWIFDVEIFARLQLTTRATKPAYLRDAIYEFPLDAWKDVAGSAVKRGDFAKAAGEMARIYWTYLRAGAPLANALAPPPVSLGSAPVDPSTTDQQQRAA